MNLKEGYVTEQEGWPPTQYGQREQGLLGWIVDCENGKEVIVATNLGQYLEDDDEDDMDYDGNSGEEIEYGSDDESDDSEFWSDDSEYWAEDSEFFARQQDIAGCD